MVVTGTGKTSVQNRHRIDGRGKAGKAASLKKEKATKGKDKKGRDTDKVKRDLVTGHPTGMMKTTILVEGSPRQLS